ncbi:hypothetical protein C0580_02680 [Candidatus Parcubacteria bacterium]|nr:MAG: hypothetical protein C0580_02680 [Candidatus Parcubacteria bacterium]
MPTGLFQAWGGVFYLLNKIFLWASGRNIKRERKLRILAWTSYIIGLPGWDVLFVLKRNWIAFSIEAGGLPAMALGLIIAIRGQDRDPPAWLDKVARVAIVLGIGYSLYDYRGFNTISQFLEISLVTGYFIGTYLLAKKNPQGYLWFVLMNISCAALMWVQDFYWLFAQQIVSLGFVIDAYRTQRKQVSES